MVGEGQVGARCRRCVRPARAAPWEATGARYDPGGIGVAGAGAMRLFSGFLSPAPFCEPRRAGRRETTGLSSSPSASEDALEAVRGLSLGCRHPPGPCGAGAGSPPRTRVVCRGEQRAPRQRRGARRSFAERPLSHEKGSGCLLTLPWCGRRAPSTGEPPPVQGEPVSAGSAPRLGGAL